MDNNNNNIQDLFSNFTNPTNYNNNNINNNFINKNNNFHFNPNNFQQPFNNYQTNFNNYQMKFPKVNNFQNNKYNNFLNQNTNNQNYQSVFHQIPNFNKQEFKKFKKTYKTNENVPNNNIFVNKLNNENKENIIKGIKKEKKKVLNKNILNPKKIKIKKKEEENLENKSPWKVKKKKLKKIKNNKINEEQDKKIFENFENNNNLSEIDKNEEIEEINSDFNMEKTIPENNEVISENEQNESIISNDEKTETLKINEKESPKKTKIDISEFLKLKHKTDEEKLKMCSSKEVSERESQNLLSVFELDPKLTKKDPQSGNIIKKANPSYCIQTYIREGGDMNQSECVRTPETLKKTLFYILDNIIDSDKIINEKFTKLFPINLSEIVLFTSDRLKAIKKDFMLNNLKNNKYMIQCYELIARFLILCINETLDIKTIKGKQGLYNLNVKELNSVLNDLYKFYTYNDENNKNDVYVSNYQEEFLAYFLLLSLKNPIDYFSILSKIKNNNLFKNSNKIKLVINISKCYLNKDYKTFMKILKNKQTDYLISCLMVLLFVNIRNFALDNISYNFNKVSNSIYKISINELLNCLPFNDPEEVINYLNYYGIKIKDENKNDFNSKIEIIKNDKLNEEFNNEIPLKTNYKYVEIKKGNKTRREVILGNNPLDYIEKDLVFKEKKEKINIDNIDNDNDNNMKIDIKNDIKKEDDIKIKTEEIIKPSVSKEKNEIKNETFVSPFNIQNLNTNIIKEENQIEFKKSQEINLNKNNENNIILSKSFSSKSSSIEIENNNLKLKYFLKTLIYILKLSFFIKLKYYSEQLKLKEELSKNFLLKKKLNIFCILKNNVKESKLYKEYLNELKKLNNNINAYNTNEKNVLNQLSKDCNQFLLFNKNFKLYSYEDIKYYLISNFLEDLNNNSIINDNNNINYVQINFYTQKELLFKSGLLQNLNLNNNLIHNNNNETIIYDPNIYVDQQNLITFIMRFIYCDKINNIENYIYENQQNINKFTYGIFFFDLNNKYYNKNAIDNLLNILNFFNNFIEKKFFVIFPNYNEGINKIKIKTEKEFINLLMKKNINENIKSIFEFYIQLNNDMNNNYFIYMNNKNFIELFIKKEIIVHSFNLNKKYVNFELFNNKIKSILILNKIKIDFENLFNNEIIYYCKNPIFIQFFYGIGYFKIISELYFFLSKNFLNDLNKIPTFLSSQKINNYSENLNNVCEIFYYFKENIYNNYFINCIESINNLNNQNLFFDSVIDLYKILINLFVNCEKINYLKLKEFDFQFKNSFYKANLNNYYEISFILINFFNQIFLLIGNEYDLFINEKFSYELLEKMYNNNINKILDDIYKLLITIKDNNFKRVHSDIISENNINKDAIKSNLMELSIKLYLNKKRKREYFNYLYKKDNNIKLSYLNKDTYLKEVKSNFINNLIEQENELTKLFKYKF